MHRVTGVVLAAALAGGSCFVALAPGAAATSSSTVVPVVCGATLTHNTTLTHDLHCTTGPGLILLGNITLNLGGHGIYGPGSTFPGYDAILIQRGATPTVTNGRIQKWLDGINGSAFGGGAYGLNVSHVTFTQVGTAIVAANGTYNVTNSTFSEDGYGLYGNDAFDTVTHSSFYQVGTSIGIWSGGDITASYDSFTAPTGPSNQSVFGVENSEGGSSVDHSSFHNIKTAISSWFGPENLSNVTITGATTAYAADYFGGGTLTNVVFSHNITGIALDTISKVTVSHGTFEFNGNSIYLQPGNGLPSTISVASSTFYKNLGDGVNLDVPGSSLKSVQAIDNAGHGISAIAGTLDLGGNRAHGNATSPQCVGVVCTP